MFAAAAAGAGKKAGPNPAAALRRQPAPRIGEPAISELPAGGAGKKASPQPAAAGLLSTPVGFTLSMPPGAPPAAAGAKAESPELTALVNSFATLFQVEKPGTISPTPEEAQAMSKAIITAILEDDSSANFEELMSKMPKIFVDYNAEMNVVKARTLKASRLAPPAGAVTKRTTMYTLNKIPIGKGSYGTIYKEEDGEKVVQNVFKEIIIKKTRIDFNQLLRGAMTEILIQHILSNDMASTDGIRHYGNHVAKPYKVYINTGVDGSNLYKIYIHMDFIPQTLNDYMKTSPSIIELANCFIKLINILQYFRTTYQFYHCDFHTGNIMFNKGEPVIIDFGFASLTPKGLPRIYGAYRGIESVNDILMFIVAFIKYYGESVDPRFRNFLYNRLWASRIVDSQTVHAYREAQEIGTAKHLFHNFYYYAEYGNPRKYTYPFLEYSDLIVAIQNEIKKWEILPIPIKTESLPKHDPSSLHPALVLPHVGLAIVSNKLGASVQIKLLSGIGEEANMGNLSAAAGAAAAASKSIIPAGQPSLSGLKRERNSLGGARRTRKPKRSARKTHKKPSRR